MIEIQCTSCNTRYRIDERVLPDETPTFKCSRCGHVFSADPGPAKARKLAAVRPRPAAKNQPPAKPVQGPVAAPARAVQAAIPAEPEPEKSAPPPAPGATAPAADARQDDPLERPFRREPSPADSRDNLAFDFSESEQSLEDEPEAPAEEEKWEVGDTPPGFEVAPEPPTAPALPPMQPPRAPEPQPAAPRFAPAAARSVGAERPYISDEDAFIVPHGSARSSSWFLGVFFLIAIGFGLVSLAICGEPVMSARLFGQIPGFGERFERPIVPAMLVALHDVHAGYQRIKGGQTALVVSGTAENVGTSALHAILIAVDLLDGTQRQLSSQTAWCGNNLSARMIGEMTPREIEFLERLDPQKSFLMEPSRSAPFLLVFITPPPDVAALRISVAKAATSETGTAEPRG
ncbi:MAG TPA: zinc-ribbon domain-containing protein [Candidatus Binataceae bacterium]|nr:zinc-ribbon domain-containing protein [Candidatus Binataceae bacterium]